VSRPVGIVPGRDASHVAGNGWLFFPIER
jgi:hypothetical protein